MGLQLKEVNRAVVSVWEQDKEQAVARARRSCCNWKVCC